MTPRTLGRIVVAAGLATLLALAGCGLQPSARVMEPVGPALSASFAHPVAPAHVVAPAIVAPVAVGSLEVRAVNLGFEQRSLAVAAPGTYEVRLLNRDAVPHEVVFDDGTRLAAAPGQSVTALVDIPAEGSTFLCVIPAHREAGMVGQVTVDE